VSTVRVLLSQLHPMRMRLPLERRRSAAYWRSSGAIYQRSRHSFAPGDRDYAATAKHALVHFSRNNKNDAHLTISGAAGESHQRYEPITQFGRGRDGFRLYHGNHRIDMRRFEPEFLVAVDLPLR
jgi:hypothetical protein